MPKFLGLESKVWIWVGGGLVALIVVYYVLQSRSGGGGGSPGGESFGGGSIGGSSPATYQGPAYAPEAADTAGDRYSQQLADLDIQARQEELRQARGAYELDQERGKQELGLWGAQQSLLYEGARAKQGLEQGFGETDLAQYRAEAGLAQAQLGQVTQEVTSGKIKGECGKGESSYYDRNTGTFKCKPSGKSGAKAAGDVVGNIARDAAYAGSNAAIAGATGGINQWASGLIRPRKAGPAGGPKSNSDRSSDQGYSNQNRGY